MTTNVDGLLRQLNEAQYGHLPHAWCTALDPMKIEDKDKARWHHVDATKVGDFFNLVRMRCPHCQFEFTCLPPPQGQ